MVTTYSGIVPISGSLFEATGSGIFPVVFFDNFGNGSVDEVEQEGNFRNEFHVITPDVFFTGGISQLVTFDKFSGSVDEVEQEGNLKEALFINPRLDFNFTPFSTATGIVVINFGFSSNFTFVVPQVLNRRIFPTDVPNATLFPGDVPRGSSLN